MGIFIVVRISVIDMLLWKLWGSVKTIAVTVLAIVFMGIQIQKLLLMSTEDINL